MAELDELGAEGSAQSPASVPRDYETVLDEQSLQRWVTILAEAELFAFDTETTSLYYTEAQVVGVSFCVQPGEAAYVPCGHDYPGAPDVKHQTPTDYLVATLKAPAGAQSGDDL